MLISVLRSAVRGTTRALGTAVNAARGMTLDSAPSGIRMGNTVEHIDTVIADLVADKRMPDVGEKCDGLKGLKTVGFLTAEQLPKDCAPSP